MFLAAVLAFAGVVAGLLGAAALVKRFFAQRDLYLFAWAPALLALATGLAGMSLGAGLGFDSTTFRVMMLGVSFLAPLWLAWGLVELVAEGMAPVFGARLAVAAMTIVGGVVLLIDPLTGEFGTDMPVASDHYELFPMAALILGYLMSGATLAVYLIFAIVRRADRDGAPRMMAASTAGGGGLVVIISSALGLPSFLHALFATATTAAIWYGGSRRAVPPEDDDEAEEYDEPTPQPVPSRGRRARHGASPLEEMRRQEAATGRMDAPGGRGREIEPSRRGAPSGAHASQRGDDSPPAFGREVLPGRTGAHAALPRGDDPYGDQQYDRSPPYGRDPRGEDRAGPVGAAPAGPAGPTEALGMPVAGGLHRSADIGPSPHLYGFISIFTLGDGQGPRFDQLTQDLLGHVRENEPDTLIYIAHTVPNAPLQRIFYEVYRNRGAHEEHDRQPHVRHFHAERANCVLATNVIELKLGAAKISPAGPLFGDPTRR